MNLQDLNSVIHSATKSQFESGFEGWKSSIIEQLFYGSNDDWVYYHNHVGRELIKKCVNFGLNNLIFDNYDSGNRPLSKIWRPSDLDSVSIWLDASDADTITLDSNDRVSLWQDKSPRATKFSNPQEIERPTLGTFNSKTSIHFNEHPRAGDSRPTTDKLISETSAFADEGTNITEVAIFLVSELNSLPNKAGHYPIVSMGSNFRLNHYNNGILYFMTGTAAQTSSTTPLSNGDKTIISAVSSASQSSRTLFINGQQEKNNTGLSNLNFIAEKTFNVEGFLSNDYDNEIGEILITSNKELSTEDRQRVEGYLAYKWGLLDELNVSHPYKETPPLI